MALGEIIAGVGGLGSLIGGMSANKSSKELQRRQRDIANEQLGLFRTAKPYYGDILSRYAGFAGLGGSPGLQQVGEGHYRMGDNYGTPEDQLRLQQGEEDINRFARQNANRLRFQLGQRGIASGTQAAALAANQRAAAQDYGNFRRQLAIQAQGEQERRLANLTGLLGLGFGQGGVAQSVLGQQAGQYGQQAAGQFGNLGNILQQYMYQRQLGQLGQAGAGGGEAYPYSAGTYSPAIPGLPGGGQENLPWWTRTDPRSAAMLRSG